MVDPLDQCRSGAAVNYNILELLSESLLIYFILVILLLIYIIMYANVSKARRAKKKAEDY